MSCFFALVGLLLAVSIVTFLRAVSLWSVLTLSLVFIGMVLAFLLGAFAGQAGRGTLWAQRVGNPPARPGAPVSGVPSGSRAA